MVQLGCFGAVELVQPVLIRAAKAKMSRMIREQASLPHRRGDPAQ